MKISARADYALRACIELARAGEAGATSSAVSEAQEIPQAFLQTVLGEMRKAGYVRSSVRRGGGYWLAVPADRISVADVVRAMDGPLVRVHGVQPDQLRYPESARVVARMWAAVRDDLRAALERVTLQDLLDGDLHAVAAGARPVAEGRDDRALTA